MDTFVPFRNGQEADRPCFDVSDMLQELAERLESYGLRRGVEIEVDSPPYVIVLAEPARMRQVFSQLLTLAIDATPPGGDVIVTAYQEEEIVEVEFAEGGAEMVDSPDVRGGERGGRIDVRRTVGGGAASAGGGGSRVGDSRLRRRRPKAYILKLGCPGTEDAESLKAA
jgi:signal transduction histidine kinase